MTMTTTTGMTMTMTSTRKTTMTDAKRTKADERLEKEAAARRALFVASLAGFVALFALIAASGTPETASGVAGTAMTGAAAPSDRVIAEVPVANLNGDGAETIIRIVAPDQGAAATHLRTRAS
jgi:hypothetical protein